MVTCPTCWWADFSVDAPGKHIIHEEPDYLQQKGFSTSPPMMRVIRTCSKGLSYFETFGLAEHDCKAWTAYKQEEKKLEAAEDEGRKTWTGRTSRYRIPMSSNILELLVPMTEDNSDAYAILIEIFAMGGTVIGDVILALNDMNIRGAQIPIAFAYADNDADLFITRVKQRSPRMVKAVNAVPNEQERAVTSGAHSYGHKKGKPPEVELKHVKVEAVAANRKSLVLKRKLKR